MIIKNIEINHTTNKIRIVRAIKVSPDLDSRGLFNFPDDVSTDEGDIELKDPIPFGSSVIFPFKPNFPKDLNRFEGKRFKLLTKQKSQIIGTFLNYKIISSTTTTTNMEYNIAIDVEAYFSEISDKILPKGPFSISSLEIQDYFPLDYVITGQFTRPKIKIESINIPREILMSYTIPFNAYSMNGYIVHSIKGIKSESLYYWDPANYNNKNNKEQQQQEEEQEQEQEQEQINPSFEITVTTTYYWAPIWTIFGSDVTLTIVKDGFVYVVNNICAVRNTLSPIVLSSFTTHCSKAMLLQPGGSDSGNEDSSQLEHAIYFKALSYLSNDLVYFEDDYHSINNNNLNEFFKTNQNNNNNQELLKLYNYNHKFINSTKQNGYAVIKLNFQNDKNQLYKNYSYESIVATRQKAIVFPQFKISNQCTHINIQYSDSMFYRFLNGSNFNTSVLVYKDFKQSIVNNNYNNEEIKSLICSESIKLEESLYLFDCNASSIYEFSIRVLSSKTLYLNYSLPLDILSFLNNNNLKIDLSLLNGFVDVSFEKFDLEFHKQLGTLLVNEKFDDKQINKPNIEDSIFENKIFTLKDYVN